MPKDEIKILFEDDDLVIIDKPAGVVVNRAESVVGETVQDWVEQWYKIKDLRFKNEAQEEIDLFLSRSGVAHRLDKDTSGCLLIARHPKALISLLGQFKDRTVQKAYVALVVGKMEPKEGSIRLPLSRDMKNRKRFRVWPGGKLAETEYAATDYYQHADGAMYSFVRLRPKTGRTHQLRVHLAHIKHPIVADDVYGGRQAVKEKSWCPRHFLHAAQITVQHPETGKSVSVEAHLSQDLQQALETLQRVG